MPKHENRVIIGLVIAFAIGAVLCLSMIKTGFRDFAEGYFYGAVLAVSIPVGALGIRLIYALTGGRWGKPIEKYFVSASNTLPLALVLWIPVFFWLARLYVWAQPNLVAVDADIAHKAAYLNVPFFIVRSAVYFALWIFAAWWLDRKNAKTDLSGLLAVLYFLAGTFAAMDWVMSLLPKWYSTVFAATFITGQVLLAFCSVVMVNGFGGRHGAGGAAPPGAFIDEGSLILTMVLFWAYLAFSQFLIIWMGNMPHEISWYLGHTGNGWSIMAPVIIIGHFFIPFFLLLGRDWKAHPEYLAVVALVLILMRACDMAWMIFSGLGRNINEISALHAGAVLVIISLYLLAWLWQTQRTRLPAEAL